MQYDPLPPATRQPAPAQTRKRRNPWPRRLLRPPHLLWVLPLVVAALGAVLGVAVAAAISMPHVDGLADFSPGQITHLLDRHGQPFRAYALEHRLLLREGDVPERLELALIAAEDRNFHQHGGIDAQGVARAALVNLVQRRKAQGASTLTMQLARQLFLTLDKSWRRKIEEILTAVELEKTLSKQQILTLYCNLMFLGHGNYGFESAARDYFGRSASELSLAETATLVGIVQRPSHLSPYRSPERVTARRNYVLRRMLEEGFIGEDEYEDAAATPLLVVERRRPHETAPYFAEEVRRYVERTYGAAALYERGWTVETTVDPAMQRAAEAALRAGLQRIDRLQGWRGALRRLEGRDLESYELPSWREETPAPGSWRQGIVLEAGPRSAHVRIGPETYTLAASSVEWTGRQRPDQVLRAGDVAWFEVVSVESDDRRVELVQEPELEGAVLVLESSTGAVRAMVGGWDFDRSSFNRATQARRQAGSAFKPFVFGAALEMGFTPADTLFDGPAVFAGADNRLSYSPRNIDREYKGIITLRQALEQSVNVTTVKLLDLVGIDTVIDFARRAGISSPLPPFPSLALGTAELVPLETAAAFATFANQGIHVEPYLIERITSPDGRLLEENHLRAHRAVDPAIAGLLTGLMEGVIRRGTAHRVAGVGIEAAGKTGTTDGYTDAWFVGYTPRYTILAWVGHDVRRPIGRNMTGAEAALPIWRGVVERGLEEGWLARGERFGRPSGLVRLPVEYSTGRLATPAARHVIQESFLPGTEPALEFDREWDEILALPWYLQRAFYIPKEGERMPEDVKDWERVQQAWSR